MTNQPAIKTSMKKRSPWLIFLLVTVAQFMVVLDGSITNVALPAIKVQLHFNDSSLQWVITAYALAFGGFLLLGGRAADLFGRRRTLLIGLVGFSLFSLLIGFSTSATALIVLRALQGLAAAIMSPSALSIVLTTFEDGRERNRALAYWTLVATGGAAVGLLLGGFLTQYFDWQWNFFINVPVGIVIALLIYRIVPVHEKEERSKGLDLPGAALVTSSLIAFVYGFSEAPVWGWLALPTVGIITLAVILLVAFIWNESRTTHPLVPLTIFKIRNVSGANLMMAPIFAGMLGTFFMTTLYMQTVLGYPPFLAGLSFLPFPVILGFMSTRISGLVERYGFKPFLIIGPLVAALGMIWLSFLPVDGSYFLNLLPTFIMVPFGMGVTFMPIIAAATSGVPLHEAGLASGLITTSQQMGGALGLSIISGIAASVTAAATNLNPTAALVLGFDRAFLVAAGFMLVALVVGAVIIRQPRVPMAKTTAQRAVEVGV
jgi:EmrB/QacA subfamily drug resistance transporter